MVNFGQNLVNVIKERTLAQLGPKHYFFINVIVLFWRAPVPRLPCTFSESESIEKNQRSLKLKGCFFLNRNLSLFFQITVFVKQALSIIFAFKANTTMLVSWTLLFEYKKFVEVRRFLFN